MIVSHVTERITEGRALGARCSDSKLDPEAPVPWYTKRAEYLAKCHELLPDDDASTESSSEESSKELEVPVEPPTKECFCTQCGQLLTILTVVGVLQAVDWSL